jgi:hypothetical protein
MTMVQAAWAAIGLLAVALFGMLSVLFQLGNKIEALGARVDSRIEALRARVDALGARLDSRIDALSSRVDTLATELHQRSDSA